MTPVNFLAYAVIGLILWWFTGIGGFLSGIMQSLARATASHPDVSRVFQYLANNPLIATILIVALGFMIFRMAPTVAGGAPGGGVGGIFTAISDSIRGIYNAVVIPLLRGGGGLAVAILAILVIFFMEPQAAIDGLRRMTGVQSRAVLFLLMAAILGIFLVVALQWVQGTSAKKAAYWLFLGALVVAGFKIYFPSTYVQGKAMTKATIKAAPGGLKKWNSHMTDSLTPDVAKGPVVDESKKNKMNP